MTLNKYTERYVNKILIIMQEIKQWNRSIHLFCCSAAFMASTRT